MHTIKALPWRRDPGHLCEFKPWSLLHICVIQWNLLDTLRLRQNGHHFEDNIYSIIKNVLFQFKFHWNSLWSNWQYGSIGSDNVLAPNRHQGIFWTNVGLVDWRIYASLDLNELKQSTNITESLTLTSAGYRLQHEPLQDTPMLKIRTTDLFKLARLTRPVEITRFMYCLTQWISKLLRSFEIHWVRQYLTNVVLFGIKDLLTSEMM